MQTTPQMALQARVSRMLGIGFAFSIVWLSGVGSLIALIIGLRARRIIMQSEEEISGMRLAWWCIILGGLGIVIGPLWLFHRGWI
jgi:NADH:ubiquinone oxidoreductase subunit D